MQEWLITALSPLSHRKTSLRQQNVCDGQWNSFRFEYKNCFVGNMFFQVKFPPWYTNWVLSVMVIWKVINNYCRNSEFHTIPSPIPNTIQLPQRKAIHCFCCNLLGNWSAWSRPCWSRAPDNSLIPSLPHHRLGQLKVCFCLRQV